MPRTAKRSATPCVCCADFSRMRPPPPPPSNNKKGVAAPYVAPTQGRLGRCLRVCRRFHGYRSRRPHPQADRRQSERVPIAVSLLFTSYMAVMGVAMLITGVVASRIGAKRTLLFGLVIIIAGAGLAGMSDTVAEIVGWRALWGLGNALFIATALATIVSSARGSVAQAIILYEAPLGLGIAVGPLVGGGLGSISWRGPCFGVSVLMAVARVVTTFMLPS